MQEPMDGTGDPTERSRVAQVDGRGVRALWYVAPGEAELRRETETRPRGDAVRVTTCWTALSRGTERLVFQGDVPPEVAERMRAPAQGGSFPFPVRYGYCAVGRIDGTGETVFALQPHREAFVVARDDVWNVPVGIPPRRALLAANMETALNALWDSGAGPGDRIAVIGAGVLGLLVAHLAGQLPGTEVTAIDPEPSRAPLARSLGAAFSLPDGCTGGHDVVFHASASQAGLASALSLAGQEATVVELSWYGTHEVSAPLGLDFHARRLRLISSQVGEVSPSRRPRWSRRRRLAKALELLRDDRLDGLITEEVSFDDLPGELPRLLAPGAPGLLTAIRYPAAGSTSG